MEIRLSSGKIINEYGVSAAFPLTSWPIAESIIPSMLDGTGCDIVSVVTEPVPAPYQSVSRDGVEQIDGAWRQKWIIRKFTADEIAVTVKAETAAKIKSYSVAMQAFFDHKAAEKNYDSRLTCTLRAGYAGPYQAEGLAFALWMDACNVHAYTVLSQVQAGKRETPTVDVLLAELPALVWPA